MGVRVSSTSLASQLATVARPMPGGTGRLVVVCHGAGTAYDFVADHGVSWPTLRTTAYWLAERGYTVVVPQLIDSSLASAGQTWGNNASTTQLDSVVTAAKALAGVSAGNYALIGCSMGALTALNHARRKSYTGIAGVLGLIPATVINSYRGTTAAPGSNYAEINAAFGVSSNGQWNAVRATYEPANFGASFTFPVGLWTNSNDTFAPSSDAAALAATNATWITQTNLGVSAGASGHDFDLVTPDAVDSWLAGLSW